MKFLNLVLALLLSANFSAQNYTLNDFLANDSLLDVRVSQVLSGLSEEERVGQLLMPAVGRHGKPTEHVLKLVKERKVGGILLLNGSKPGFTEMVKMFDSVSKEAGGLPFLFSADAEPSLIKYKIKECAPVKNANKHTSSKEVELTAQSISKDLNDIGINYNFAPVLDQGTGNEAITNRSFGFVKDSILKWSNTFIKTSQDMGILTTAKHFPGHGLVKGDSHEKLVFIDGVLEEVDHYKPVIKKGVLSIMVGHIAVKNNPEFGTHGMPATCSKKIVSGLLKDELGFKGLIVTDAMNMGGVRNIPDCGLKAIEAGCDILLMPVDEEKDINSILNKYRGDSEFKAQVDASVSKILRAKICLGLIQ